MRFLLKFSCGRLFLLFLVQLQGLAVALQAQDGQQGSQSKLDEECWESFQNNRAELSASDCGRHHNCDKTVVNQDNVFLLWVLSLEIVDESHGCANKNTEAGYCDSVLRVEFKKRNDQSDGDTTSSNSSHCAQSHDKSKCEHSYHFSHTGWKDTFVTANSRSLTTTNIVRFFTVFICETGLVDLAKLINIEMGRVQIQLS